MLQISIDRSFTQKDKNHEQQLHFVRLTWKIVHVCECDVSLICVHLNRERNEKKEEKKHIHNNTKVSSFRSFSYNKPK